MFLLFSCDNWRSHSSMELYGVYDDVNILQEEIVDIFREELEEFYKEYRELCKKHNLMVCSDGEEVQISKYEEGLWGLKESTERWNRLYERIHGKS